MKVHYYQVGGEEINEMHEGDVCPLCHEVVPIADYQETEFGTGYPCLFCPACEETVAISPFAVDLAS